MPVPYSTPPECAPLRPTPLRGWRRLGAGLMDSALFTENHTHNPLVTYFTGARKGWLAEDALGFLPWIAAFLANAIALRWTLVAGRTTDYFRLLLLEMAFMPLFVALTTGLLVAWHFRRVVYRLPFQQIVVTPIARSEISHAVCIRPLAVQSVALIFMAVTQLLLVGATWRYATPRGNPLYYGVAVIAIFLAWSLAGTCSEIAGAMTLRAQLFLRGGFGAFMRFLGDYLFSECGLLLAILLLACYGITFIYGPGGAVIGLGLIALTGGTVAGRGARTILSECNKRWEDWWMFREASLEPDAADLLRVNWDTLFARLEEAREDQYFGEMSPRLGPRGKRRPGR